MSFEGCEGSEERVGGWESSEDGRRDGEMISEEKTTAFSTPFCTGRHALRYRFDSILLSIFFHDWDGGLC